MKKKILTFFFIIFFSFTNFLYGKINNNIILTIENETITSYDIKNKIMTLLILSNTKINQSNIDKFKKQALDNLILQRLKKIELSKYNIKDDSAQLNLYLNSISSNNIEEFKKRFLKSGVSFDIFVDELKTEFKWQKLIYNIYSKKIVLDENIVEKELKEIIKNETGLAEYELSELEILIDQNDIIEDKIQEVKTQILDLGFENAVLNYSISSTATKQGYLGWINSKSLSSDIYKVITKMKIGEISKPIKRQNSILFLKLNNKKTSDLNQLDKNKLKENLVNLKKNELFNLYSRSHLSKLKNNSFIDYK